MRAVFIGCIDFSSEMVSACLEKFNQKRFEIIGLVTKAKSNFNSDFKSLASVGESRHIPVFNYDKDGGSNLPAWLRTMNPDIVFCVGWSHLLPTEILKIPRLGVIGFHPAALPKNRGRHPLIWTLALGLSEAGSSFFVMDEGADSGDLVSQRLLPVGPDETAGELYRRVTVTAKEQIFGIIDQALEGCLKRTSQDHSKANTWRKRSAQDGQIDWRMPARSIHNLIRALAKPYPGAHCLWQNSEIKIWKASVVKETATHLEPGKILAVDGHHLRIKCGEDALDIQEHEFEILPKVGEYL